MGCLSGIFVAQDTDVEKIMGTEVCLEEVLGKHSDITATIDEKSLKVLTDDRNFINKFLKFKCTSGTNPVATWLDEQYQPE